jgi:uncharacterized protein YcfJ
MKKIILTAMTLATLAIAEDMSYTEYAHVSSSTPTYENITTRIPHQECYDRQVPVASAYDSGGYYQDNSGAAVMGGIIGGVLGHQIGGGHGKDAATIGGAILGTVIARNASRRQSQQRVYQATTSYQTQRECSTRYTEQSERRFTGYKNVAYYKGRKIVKYSDTKLSSIPITVTLSY